MSQKTHRKIPAIDPSLRAAVLSLYFQEQLTQAKIAARLGIHPAVVNGIIQGARKDGTVRIELRLERNEELAGGLRKLIPRDVPNPMVMVPRLEKVKDKDLRLDAVGQEAAKVLADALRDGVSLAIDGGGAVAKVIESLQRSVAKDLKLFPIAGGPLLSPLTSIPTLIGRFLGKYDGLASKVTAHLLPGPATKRAEGKQAGVHAILRKASQADVFLLGVGAVSRDASNTANLLIEELNIDKERLLKTGAIGITGYSTFDERGEPVKSEFDEKVIKVDPKHLFQAARSKSRRVIAVTTGSNKAVAIRALLRRGWINVLVTDPETASAVIRLDEAMKREAEGASAKRMREAGRNT